jgi:hypothetical protein
LSASHVYSQKIDVTNFTDAFSKLIDFKTYGVSFVTFFSAFDAPCLYKSTDSTMSKKLCYAAFGQNALHQDSQKPYWLEQFHSYFLMLFVGSVMRSIDWLVTVSMTLGLIVPLHE